jgi:hypothetical protein
MKTEAVGTVQAVVYIYTVVCSIFPSAVFIEYDAAHAVWYGITVCRWT